MSVIIFLASSFAGIILIGAIGVYLHDSWERRLSERRLGERGGGGHPIFRGLPSLDDGHVPARGGQVVWVRAGGPVFDSASTQARRVGPSAAAVVSRRGASR